MKNSIFIINPVKKWLGVILTFSTIFELVLFPSVENLLGCAMAIIAYLVFLYFFNYNYIIQFPFAFLMYLSMFLYRYLPLIATLMEGKPITYGFERAKETFLYETLLFLLSSLSFFVACNFSNKYKNSFIQKRLYNLGFFETSPTMLWGLGFIGLAARIYTLGTGSIEFSDVSGKFLSGLKYLMYSPILLLFPSLLNITTNISRYKILVYVGGIFIINLSTNSREAMITPFAVIGILFFLYTLKINQNIFKIVSPIKITLLTFVLIFTIDILADLSTAMIYTRAVRSKVSKVELFEKTLVVYENKVLINKLRHFTSITKGSFYSNGWTEDYLGNFMLNRYANMRISDQTLYYAEKRGYNNEIMKDGLIMSVLILLPTPLIKGLGFKIDKSNYNFSRGDLLYGMGSLRGFRVTSHIGDGLATFGFGYFFIQFFVYIIVFFLLNTFVIKKSSEFIYAPFALINVFEFLGMFRNAHGITGDIHYCIRGYFEGIVTYFICKSVVIFFAYMFRINYKPH